MLRVSCWAGSMVWSWWVECYTSGVYLCGRSSAFAVVVGLGCWVEGALDFADAQRDRVRCCNYDLSEACFSYFDSCCLIL